MSDNDYAKIDKHIAEGTAYNNLAERATINHGSRGELPLFLRYVVLETIFDPTTIDAKKIAYFEHVLGVANTCYANSLPRNTIVARRVLDNSSNAMEPAMFLFPFFSHMSFPCKPGEHVWVMFENPSGKLTDMGYWFNKIVEPGYVDDVNHTHAPRANDVGFSPNIKDVFEGSDDPKYEFRNGRAEVHEGKRYTVAETAPIPGDEREYEKLLTKSEASKLINYEAVPRYRKRPGEFAFEGSNNTLIVLGCDRTGAVAKYKVDPSKGKIADGFPSEDNQKGDAGAIDLVVGRGQDVKTAGKKVKNSLDNKEIGKATKDLVENEGDPDLRFDRSRVLISQRTNPDTNFKIDSIVKTHTKENEVKDVQDGCGAVVIKSDKIRLISRQDIVILVLGAKDSDKDPNGNVLDPEPDPKNCASVTIRANGDIIFTPASTGIIKLGGEDANIALLGMNIGATNANGEVTAPPIMSTMGGQCGLGSSHGLYATKILAK